LAGTPGQPVLQDGSVVVPSVIDSDNLQLTFVRPTGAVETQAVNVPNGSLFYPYRAVPNGQGGLLVQLRRRLWPGTETEVWDAVVVGVDAAGTLTGQTPLADDWGEIVVGENGNILVTSQVEYWTDPGYASVPKYHVGFLQQITPEGNPAAIGEFYPPSGPCGWQWDGLSQSWYYNGDCDQDVISITSVAARGSTIMVTLNDGRVFAPEPLGQLQLSYLVPASDGTYLGVGAGASDLARAAAARSDAAGTAEAGALMAFVVPSEEPASPFGADWPIGGGGTEDAHAANLQFEPRPTPELAVFDSSRELFGGSQTEQREYGGKVCRQKTGPRWYQLSSPVKGPYCDPNPDPGRPACSVDTSLASCPDGTDAVSTYHTHPFNLLGPENQYQDWSDGDYWVLVHEANPPISWRHDDYVLTFCGEIQRLWLTVDSGGYWQPNYGNLYRAPSNVVLFPTKFQSKTGCRVLLRDRRLWKVLQ
jgi:hypothetical protein